MGEIRAGLIQLSPDNVRTILNAACRKPQKRLSGLENIMLIWEVLMEN